MKKILMDFAAIPGLTVTHMDGEDHLQVLVNDSGLWFNLLVADSQETYFKQLHAGSQHWILYNGSQASIVGVSCPDNEFTSLAKDVITLLQKCEDFKTTILIPITVIEVVAPKQFIKVQPLFKPDAWMIEFIPNLDGDYRLDIAVIK